MNNSRCVLLLISLLLVSCSSMQERKIAMTDYQKMQTQRSECLAWNKKLINSDTSGALNDLGSGIVGVNRKIGECSFSNSTGSSNRIVFHGITKEVAVDAHDENAWQDFILEIRQRISEDECCPENYDYPQSKYSPTWFEE